MSVESPKRNGGSNVLTLKQRCFTPSEGNIPRIVVSGHSHRPHLLRQKLEQETSLRAKERPTEGKTLDGFCLLEASGVEFPDAARAAVLSEKHLTNVVFEDLSFFIELQYLDLSENTLPMEPFGILPNLRELRLSCNNISDLDVLEGFPTLNTLDLSYNSLTPGCVHALQQIQALRELDLCGNDLRELPPSMVHFVNLEKLLLENNKIEDNEIFFTLAGMPSLRILSLAYNFLSKIPVDSCGPRLYRLLDCLDLSFNFFGSEEDVQPFINLQRIKSVMLYGNPVLGPTGEDSMKIYIEDLANAAIDSRIGNPIGPIDIITEIPRKRTLKKGQMMSRQMVYRDFPVVLMKKEDSKTMKEWKSDGNKTLFAEAVELARSRIMSPKSAAEKDSSFFLTRLEDGAGTMAYDETGGEGSPMVRTTLKANMATSGTMAKSKEEEFIADMVMSRVAEDALARSSADILSMRRSVTIQTKAKDKNELLDMINSVEQVNLGEAHGQEEDRGERVSFERNETVPSGMFGRTMTEASTISPQPVAMKTALRALRFAIEHPLTNYSEVPTKGNMPPKDYIKETESSNRRKVSRTVRPITLGDTDVRGAPDKTNTNGLSLRVSASEPVLPKRTELLALNPGKDKGRRLAEPFAAFATRKKHEETTLQQIEHILDGLDRGTAALVNKSNTALHGANTRENLKMMKTFVERPNTGVANLIDMVREVVSDIDF